MENYFKHWLVHNPFSIYIEVLVDNLPHILVSISVRVISVENFDSKKNDETNYKEEGVRE